MDFVMKVSVMCLSKPVDKNTIYEEQDILEVLVNATKLAGLKLSIN